MRREMWIKPNRAQVLKAYADAGMRLQTAAKALGMSNRGVEYHLNRAKEETGLDPRNFWELVRLLRKIGYEP